MAEFNPNEYFRQLAEQHVDLKHTAQEPSYFREFSSSKIIFDNSDFLSKMRYAKRAALVSQFNKDGNIFGPHNDSHFRSLSGAVYIIVKVIDKNYQEAQDIADRIMEDIYWRMIWDSDQNNISPENNIRFNDIMIHSIGSIGDNYYGVAAFLNYVKPLCEVHDSTRWT